MAMSATNNEIKIKITVKGDLIGLKVVDFLANKSKLPKAEIKRALDFGCLSLKSIGKNKKCLRKATYLLKKDDQLEFHYKESLIIEARQIEKPIEIYSEKGWGIWYKPSGILSYGNKYGDGSSILRFVEKSKGEAYLIHRLDRESSGLMAFAYNKKAAQYLSRLWVQRKVKKYYQIIVRGILEVDTKWQEIDYSLEGKEAITKYQCKNNNADETSFIDVEILTGRMHQIRRHFDMLGYPVMGDPKYGRNNKNQDGLKLLAYALEFVPPGEKSTKKFNLPSHLLLF